MGDVMIAKEEITCGIIWHPKLAYALRKFKGIKIVTDDDPPPLPEKKNT